MTFVGRHAHRNEHWSLRPTVSSLVLAGCLPGFSPAECRTAVFEDSSRIAIPTSNRYFPNMKSVLLPISSEAGFVSRRNFLQGTLAALTVTTQVRAATQGDEPSKKSPRNKP